MIVSTTDSGYQVQTSFTKYVKDHLLPEVIAKGIPCDAEHPIFYFVDGHRSHYNTEFQVWCREHFVELITLYPNGTRILQPLDVGLFSAAKTVWKKEVQKWKFENPDAQFDEIEFVKVLENINGKFLKEDSIKNAFFRTGIFPLDKQNIDFSRCLGTSRDLNENQDENVEIGEDNGKRSLLNIIK